MSGVPPSDRLGPESFGLTIVNGGLGNWEAGDRHQLIGGGWTVWCDPRGREFIQDGDLVVVDDPVYGLRCGVYLETAAGLVVETDDPRLTQQERHRAQPEWIAGPVVYATTGGTPHRCPRLEFRHFVKA